MVEAFTLQDSIDGPDGQGVFLARKEWEVGSTKSELE